MSLLKLDFPHLLVTHCILPIEAIKQKLNSDAQNYEEI